MSSVNFLQNNCPEKTIYWRRNKKYWAILLMPDNIRIDNNHGYCHIHLKNKKNHHPLKNDSFESIYQIISDHIQENNQIDMDKLKKELDY
ncbi:hypothetical protein [Methanobacterium alcaliphilum]|uniref:hypothetical protein n=1 Tax=Methanobacterium alcaliphilum TaxID=392018 RepID=UPI00200B405C|nr:hypothetical protein [Methanobacterium alcaliphilum]MCK9152288.1 hypothetical protein [Methanobacterium alcaliphilum]